MVAWSGKQQGLSGILSKVVGPGSPKNHGAKTGQDILSKPDGQIDISNVTVLVLTEADKTDV